MNIMIAEFMHETNTFHTQKTELSDFAGYEYLTGRKVIPHFHHVKNEMGGFLDVLDKYADEVAVISGPAAQATPGGTVKQDVYDTFLADLKSAVGQAPKLDGVLFAMHGAMVTEQFEDGEGEMLEELRKLVGEKIPVFVTLDLHAAITEKMVKYATALFPCDYYPHTDIYDKGVLAAELMMKTLKGEIHPVMKAVKLKMIFPIMPTTLSPMKELSDKCIAMRGQNGILSTSVTHGFLCADTSVLGACALAVTDGDEKLALAAAEKLAKAVWEKRNELKREFYSTEEALEKIEADDKNQGFYVLADITDNPGGGATGDGTHVLGHMLKRGVDNAAFASIYDPETVELAEKSGVGTTIHCHLGGKSAPKLVGEPIECEAYVKSLSDGTIIYKGVMDHGGRMSTGKTAVLVIDGIQVIVTSKRLQPRDIEIFRANGIEPKDKRIIVTKSSVHYRASYEPEAIGCFDVEEPGIMPQRPESIRYEKVSRPVYPLDEAVENPFKEL